MMGSQVKILRLTLFVLPIEIQQKQEKNMCGEVAKC